MRPHARRLLLYGLLVAVWGGDASAAPEAPRGAAAAVPQGPVEVPRTTGAAAPAQPLQPDPEPPPTGSSSTPAVGDPLSTRTPAAPGDDVSATRSDEAAASDAPGSDEAAASDAPGSDAPGSDAPGSEEARPPEERSSAAETDTAEARRKRSRSPGAIELVPRQFGLELGWSNLAIDNLPDVLVPDPRPHPHGVATGSHVMWQIAGLSRRWPTWIGPRIGLDVFPATPVSRRVIAVSYGLQFKHQFGRHPRIRPFLSYGVGAVQSWVKTIPGREIGHQLQTSFGAAFPVAERTSLTFAFAYKFHGLATFRWDDAGTLAYNFHTIGLLAGITLDASPRRTRKRRRSGKAPPRGAAPRGSAPRSAP